MHTLRTLALSALVVGFLGTANADTLLMDSMAPDSNSTHPTRGMTQNSVESRYGSPDTKMAAVGDPPISRWEYKEFIVFFEYDRVIHAVTKR